MNHAAVRAELLRLLRVGIARADPAAAVEAALQTVDPPTRIVALGKAAIAMTRPVLARHPGVPALVATNPENAADLPGARVLLGAHPVPEASSEAAGTAILDVADALTDTDRLLVLVSGGASALAVAPVEGITLEDKAETVRLMLGAGLDIAAMNRVRQSLSRLKGGGLARAAAPATVEALILSDVIGDDPAAIASGPTVSPLGTPEGAAKLLKERSLWEDVPATARAVLHRPAPPSPSPSRWRIVGSNALSLRAMADAASEAVMDPDPLVGDVADAAERIARAACPGTRLWGGETTVTLRGDGKGGRNQELALRVAVALEVMDRPWVFLSGGTDGRDGPTDAAGAMVDDGTLARVRAAGLDPLDHLARNDAYPALDAAGDLIRTGGTGTNVADLQILHVG